MVTPSTRIKPAQPRVFYNILASRVVVGHKTYFTPELRPEVGSLLYVGSEPCAEVWRADGEWDVRGPYRVGLCVNLGEENKAEEKQEGEPGSSKKHYAGAAEATLCCRDRLWKTWEKVRQRRGRGGGGYGPADITTSAYLASNAETASLKGMMSRPTSDRSQSCVSFRLCEMADTRRWALAAEG